MEARIVQGDCLEVMKKLRDASIDAIVTDPPYGLEFMGKEWDRCDVRQPFRGEVQTPDNPYGRTPIRYGYGDDKAEIGRRQQEWHLAWAREALRVLKPGGHLLAFGGTRTYHRLACAIEDAGFEIRDSIDWIYGQGFPKSLDVSKAIDKMPMITADDAKRFEGWGTALKPAHEPIVVARKPLIGTVAENVLVHGTGGINVNGCRILRSVNDVSGWSLSGSAESENCAMSGKNYAHAPRLDATGRWPPNVVLTHAPDCSDECVPGCPVAMMDAQSGILKTPSSYTRGSDASGGILGKSKPEGMTMPGYGDSGGASRFFPTFEWSEFDFIYCAKASKSDRGAADLLWTKVNGNLTRIGSASNADDLALWNALPEKRRARGNVHPTVKPIALMRWLVRLVTPKEGIVLDPFSGSGTTGIACLHEGFHFLGIEREPTYIRIAEARLAGVLDSDRHA